VAATLAHLAYGSLGAAGLLLFAGTNLKELRRVEKVLLTVGLAGVYGLVLWLLVRPQAGSTVSQLLLTASGSLVPLLALTLIVPTLFSFWRTGFGPAWAMLALGLSGMAVSTLMGRASILPYLLFAAGLLLHYIACRSISLPRRQPEVAGELGDARRLQRASSWVATSLVEQLRQIAGDRAARCIVERFNKYALAAGWGLSIAGVQIEAASAPERTLIEQGEVRAAALNLLLDLMVEELGEKLTVRSLQHAYDGLPWEEREIGTQYLFPEVKQAASLSAEFRAVQQDYRRLLQRMPLFLMMNSAEIDLLCARLRAERRAPGQTIIRQGERGHRFYIVRRGRVEVTQWDENGVSRVVNQLDRGDYFGELALLHDVPRNATCRTTVPTELLSLSRQDFDRLVKARFDLREKLDRSIAQVEMLRRIPLFAELDVQQLRIVAAQLRTESYQPGATILRQGETGETFCLIKSGRVQVSVSDEGQEQLVAERGPGEYLGEIALLLQVPRTATVTALEPTSVLALYKSDFDRLVKEHLYVSRQLQRDSSRRMLDLRRVA
jgi:CRP-like cAMP-binding protein